MDIHISDAEWKFKSIPDDQASHCFVWEALRELRRPSGRGVRDVVADIANSAARTEWFQRFCRRKNFIPLKILALVYSNEKWPARPWSEESASAMAEVDQITFLPPLLLGDAKRYLEDRYKSPLCKSFDFLLFPFAQHTIRVPDESLFSDVRLTGQLLYDLLQQSRAFDRLELTVNWQNYTRDELIIEFEKLLKQNSPRLIEQYLDGGRIQPRAWLAGLAAFRLHQSANGNREVLASLRQNYRSQYGEGSISNRAQKFYDFQLDKWVPKKFLPPRPKRSTE